MIGRFPFVSSEVERRVSTTLDTNVLFAWEGAQ